MTRKQFKAIQNTAAKVVGRNEAKATFASRNEFKNLPGAFMHLPTANIFAK
jgi:hypothetical protein